MLRRSLIPTFAATLAIAAAGRAGAQQPGTAPRGLERAFMDTTCAACRDFFQYANGTWLRGAKIPAELSSWGVSEELDERTRATLHAVLDSLRTVAAGSDGARTAGSAGAAAGTTDYKLGVYYGTCMDSARAESEGAAPLRDELARIEAVRTPAALRSELARLHLLGVDALFSFGPLPDFDDASRMIADAAQGGLGLPDRDYYLRPDSASARTRRDYVAHVERTFGLLGESPAVARAHASTVMRLETALARASMPLVELRDPQAVKHKMTLADLQRRTPHFDWAAYLRELGAPNVGAVNLEQPAFYAALDTMLAKVPLADWRTYLRWRYVDEASPWLSSTFVREDFRFTSTLTGATELRARWKRCLREADRSLGEALGQAYVRRAFTPEAKARALALVRNLEAVLHDRLATLEWMSEPTRREAIAKLAAFDNKIGYPDRWRDCSALDVGERPFVTNVVRANQFRIARDLAKIGKPVDRTEWGMSPPTNNAYYNPFVNEIVFPAGILQPPYFDPGADDAVNYGQIGAVIGHEMTHGFDDQGRQFDARGNLRDWWAPEDARTYTARATLVSDQFDRYVALDSLRVNGKLTLGENIADLGGVKIAYAAFQRATAGKRRTPVDGLTPEQRFFIAYAQSWRSATRPETLRQRVLSDYHSPEKWRVNGPLSNMPEFAAAFGCKAGDAMVRAESLRAQIW